MRLAVAGREIYAYCAGRTPDASRPSIVFVHGAAQDHGVWLLQSRYFANHGRNVLAIDLPGHGRSGGDALPSIEAIGDFLIALLDAAGFAEAALVGHSMGSLAALEAAARAPARVSKLALIGTAFPLAVSDGLLEAALRDDPVAFELINGWSFSAARWLGGNRWPGVHMAGNTLRLMERTRSGVLATDLLACRGYTRGLEAAAKIACPALAILGGQDLMAPPRAARDLLAAIGNARVHTLPSTGHALMAEEPDAVLDLLRGFL